MDDATETGVNARIDAPRKAMAFDWKAGTVPKEEGASSARGESIGAHRPGQRANWGIL